MKDPLDKLHLVRSLREQLAQSDLAQGRHRLDQADQELSRKRARLQCHCRLKSKMEAQLFAEMDRQEVTLNEFETYCGRISDLSAKEKNCREKEQQAQAQKDSARAEVDRKKSG